MAKIRDIVCDTRVEVADTRYMSEHSGAVYFFCGVGCKAAFDREPHRFIQDALATIGCHVSTQRDLLRPIECDLTSHTERNYLVG